MFKKSLAIIFGILIFAHSLPVSANDNNVLWGIKANVDAELPGNFKGEHNSEKLFYPGAGFSIGMVSNVYLGKNFYFEPGISFYYSNYKYDLVIMQENENVNNPKIIKYGLELPLTFGYEFNFSEKFEMCLFTGPQLRYALGGDVDIRQKDVKEEYGALLLWDSYKRFDCSWKIGVGFPINRLMLSIEADLGLINLYKTSELTGKSNMSFRENRVGVGLTYYF